jgi:hypothetical protein
MNIRKVFVTIAITLLSVALSPLAYAQTSNVHHQTTRTRTTHREGPAEVKVSVTKKEPRKRVVHRSHYSARPVVRHRTNHRTHYRSRPVRRTTTVKEEHIEHHHTTTEEHH